MNEKTLSERVLEACAGKPQTVSMLRERLGVSVGGILNYLVTHGRLERSQVVVKGQTAEPFAVFTTHGKPIFLYSTTPQGARYVLALREEREQEELEQEARAAAECFGLVME